MSESLSQVVKRVLGESLKEARQLLIDAGFAEGFVNEDINAVVQIALKLAEAKFSE